MKEKECHICKITKPLTEYYTERNHRNPNSEARYYRTFCKRCFNKRYANNVVKHSQKFPGKTRARTKLRKAIKDGTLKVQPCVVCKSEVKIQAHHPDYRSALKVIWLCKKHHYDIHYNRLKL